MKLIMHFTMLPQSWRESMCEVEYDDAIKESLVKNSPDLILFVDGNTVENPKAVAMRLANTLSSHGIKVVAAETSFTKILIQEAAKNRVYSPDENVFERMLTLHEDWDKILSETEFILFDEDLENIEVWRFCDNDTLSS